MINVLSIVSYKFLPAHMGGERAIACFYKFFTRHVDLVCVTTRKNDPRAAPGYEVLNILSDKPLRYGNIFYFFTLRKIIRQRKITHILLEHPYYGWLGIMLKEFCGLKLIIRSHNMEGLRWKSLGKWWWKLLWYYERWTHRRADYNLFIQSADLAYALEHFNLAPQKCLEVTYGIEYNTPTPAVTRASVRDRLVALHKLSPAGKLLLFNGHFGYPPNLKGLLNIIAHINPKLRGLAPFPYTILICGKGIPSHISAEPPPNMVFAGFVPDIDLYFKGADIFLNPIIEGGGIKTKLVEALGRGMHAVSTENGAIGVDPSICNEKLVVVPDNDWDQFAAGVIRLAEVDRQTPPAFYEKHFWGNIAERASAFIGP